MYDISGSAHFINKADNGIVVHRVRDPGLETQVQILVRKVRNKAAGTIGDCILEYERRNGRYLDPIGGPAPSTSKRVMFTASSSSSSSSPAARNSGFGNGNNGGGFGGGGNASQMPKMYQHEDGTVSSTPPWKTGFENES